MSTDLLNSGIKVKDYGSVENKTLIQKTLEGRIKPRFNDWTSIVYQKNILRPYKTLSFRHVVYNEPPSKEKALLIEGIKPDPIKGVAYVEQTIQCNEIGFYKEFTDEAKELGFDDLVADNVDDLSQQAKGFINREIAETYLKGNNVWTFDSGLDREALSKIKISMGKLNTGVNNPEIHCRITPEDMNALILKYNVAGANLFETLPVHNEKAVIEGYITKFNGIYFHEDYSNELYGDNGLRYAVFYTKNSEGKYPVGMSDLSSSGEFIFKDVGSSGADDPLNQKGSMGYKIKGFGTFLMSEEAVVRAEIEGSDIDTIDSGYDFDALTMKVAGVSTKLEGTIATSPARMVLSATATTLSLAGTKNSTITAEDLVKGTAITGFTLTSSDTTVATVAGAVITGVKAGSCVIFAKKDGYAEEAIKIKVVA